MIFSNLEIKEIRKNLHFTQKQFAKDLKVSLASIQKWESGDRIPTEQMCYFIANKYNVGIENNKTEVKEPESSYEKEKPKENLQEKYNALMSKYVEVLEENRFVKNDLISQLKKTNV